MGLTDTGIMLYVHKYVFTTMQIWEHSGSVLDLRLRCPGFGPHKRHCVVSLSKQHLSLLNTG